MSRPEQTRTLPTVLILRGESRGKEAMVLEVKRSTRGYRRLWLKLWTDWTPPFCGRWYGEHEVDLSGDWRAR